MKKIMEENILEDRISTLNKLEVHFLDKLKNPNNLSIEEIKNSLHMIEEIDKSYINLIEKNAKILGKIY